MHILLIQDEQGIMEGNSSVRVANKQYDFRSAFHSTPPVPYFRLKKLKTEQLSS